METRRSSVAEVGVIAAHLGLVGGACRYITTLQAGIHQLCGLLTLVVRFCFDGGSRAFGQKFFAEGHERHLLLPGEEEIGFHGFTGPALMGWPELSVGTLAEGGR